MLNFPCRAVMIGAAILSLAGCSSAAKNWTKPSLDTAQRSVDYSDCSDEARQSTKRDYAIDQDIMASRGHDWQNAGIYNTLSGDLTRDGSDKSDRILQACMLGKGYAQTQ